MQPLSPLWKKELHCILTGMRGKLKRFLQKNKKERKTKRKLITNNSYIQALCNVGVHLQYWQYWRQRLYKAHTSILKHNKVWNHEGERLPTNSGGQRALPPPLLWLSLLSHKERNTSVLICTLEKVHLVTGPSKEIWDTMTLPR